MKRTFGLIVMAFAILFLQQLSPTRALQATGPTTIQAAHSNTSVVPAEDSGDDDGDDDSDSGSTE